ncbi:hypothetical protein HPB51_000222 [Rhipicephalus microplus]|uniref:CCHC-type domain-containing protein n=1 Tax=Rhipicephalus microplus TaxID=6941 RepID=A0A9J6DXY5_RHIMP|nr:hypothetical protein HPB51_000222 [Rhipicephalus microplus]
MAQPTGCESTELHAEEETTPREGATPRRTSSRDSETTIVESVFTTLDHSRMANVTKKQLVDEMRARGLRCSGRKDELIARIIRDNITRQALEPTDSSTKDQAAYDDDRQAHLETLSADNARLCAELSSLRAQLNRATTSERETLHEAHQNASLPTEWVTTPTLGLHHSVPADITMSSGSTRPPSLNDRTNQDAARPAAPTVSTHEGEPSMAQILTALVNTQALLANMLSRGPSTTSPIQIHSTSDTSSSIPLFDGTPQQSTHEWITQVERIAALAHWTPSLTLVTAASRLTGSAKDWHSAYGSQYDTWEQWKEALILRFKRKLTMQEFLELQTKRRLQSHETIVEYMYSKNAILNKAPYRLAEEEPQLCGTVTELIDRAALLDARRRTTVCAENDKKPPSSTASRGQGSNQRVPASSSANLPKANPRSDFSGAPHPRPISARSCFNCGDIGHLSRDCRKPKTPATIRADEKRAKRDNSSHETGTTSPRQANCFLHSMGGTLPIVSGTANNRPVCVCIDSGANLSIMSANALTDDIPTHAWVSHENIEVLNRSICPTLAATLDVTLGTTNVRLEDVVVTELPSGIDLILGSDWRRVANVDVTFHTSNDVTIVPVEPSGKFSSSEVPPPKQGTPHRTGETLIATFCRISDESASEDEGVNAQGDAMRVLHIYVVASVFARPSSELVPKNPQRVQPVGLVPHAGNAAQVVIEPQPVTHGAAVTEAAIHKVAFETRVRTSKVQGSHPLPRGTFTGSNGFGNVHSPLTIASGVLTLAPPLSSLAAAARAPLSLARPPSLSISRRERVVRWMSLGNATINNECSTTECQHCTRRWR